MTYLDNAATTYPKPISVSSALMNTLAAPLGNPSRGAHSAAFAASDVIYRLRGEICSHFHLEDESRVVLTKNATEALNIALFGVLASGRRRHVVTSVLEHNSVLRPLYRLQEMGCVHLHFFSPGSSEEETLAAFSDLVKQGCSFAALTVRANTTGERLPIEGICEICRREGVSLLLDASQAAGHEVLDMTGLGVHYLCVPAHKGLYGITGCGALLIHPEAEVPRPRLYGGAGYESERRDMPLLLPERLEAGTLPVHAAAAWLAGLRFVQSRKPSQIGAKSAQLVECARRELASLGFEVYGKDTGSILLFNAPGKASEDVAEYLALSGICVRAGLHCAPRAHEHLGTAKRGAVRASFGAFNEADDVEVLVRALAAYARENAF